MQGLCALVVVLAVTGSAWARAQVDLPYSQAEIFSTALRFIRIERGCKIVDKDPDAAFITFACVEGDKTKRGSLEIFASSDADHRPTLRVQVTLGDDPHYVENRFFGAIRSQAAGRARHTAAARSRA